MSASPSSQERALLLCFARLSLSGGQREEARALIRSGVDWGVFSSLAERHGLSLLVQRHLSREAADLCPAAVLERAAVKARAIAALNVMLTAELAELLPGLEAAGCQPVVVKGPALAVAVYGDLSLRQFGDVDVVVEPSSADRAIGLLGSHGYVALPPMPPRWLDTWRRGTHEQPFQRGDSPLRLDLHWELTAPGYTYSMRLEEVRPRLERVSTGVGEVWTLGPEDTLLFLCCHGTKHSWEVLSWLVDVAELVRSQPRLSWDAVLQWSRVAGRRRSVQLGLHLAHDLLEAPMPPEVLAEGDRDPKLAALVRAAESPFVDPPVASRRGPWARTFLSVQFRAQETWRDRWRHVHSVLKPGPLEWEWLPLPTWAAPAYYAIRPLRLALRELRLPR